MPSFSQGSEGSPATPAQPTHAPPLARITGSSAVTRPPGDERQLSEPSSATTLSTGRRFETTTREYSPIVFGAEDSEEIVHLCSLNGIDMVSPRSIHGTSHR